MAFDPDAYLAGSGFDPDAYLATPTPAPTVVADTGEELPLAERIKEGAKWWLYSPEAAQRVRTAIQANVDPFIEHPVESVYKMVVPQKEDFEAIWNLTKPETYEQNLEPGSQEWLNQVVGYGAAAVPGIPALRGLKVPFRPRVEPQIPLRPEVEAPPVQPPVTQAADFVKNMALDDQVRAIIDQKIKAPEPTLAERITQPRAEPPAAAPEPVEQPSRAGPPHFIGGVIPETPRLPIFTTTERTGAEWYARERGTGGQVHEIGVEAQAPLKLFNEQQVRDNLLPILDEAGVQYKYTPSSGATGWDLEIPDIAKHSPYHGENHLDVAYIPQVREALVKRGYDSIQALDVLENREIPTTVLIKDPSQMKRAVPPPTPPVEPPVPPEDVPFTPEGGGAPTPKTRKFSLQLQADTDLIQNLKDKIGNRTYEPIPNKITADQAVNLVDERPIPDVINAIQDEANAVPGHVRSAMGQIVIKRLNKAAESLGQSGKTAEADIALNQAVNLAEWMQEFGTRSGQTVQSFAMWSALSPEGKLTSVTRKVRKARANHEHENPGEVGEITGALNGDDPVAAFKKLFKTNKTARKVKPRMQKLIEAARTGKLTDQEFYDIASDRLGLPRYDPATAAEIMRLALEIDKLPEGMPRDHAVFNLNRFIATKMGFRLSDLPMGVYYGNMLSGYNTHIVNALDTFLNVGSEVTGMAMSNPRSAMKIFGNTLRGLNEGRADAVMALTRGRMLTNSRWMEMPRLMEVAKFGEKGGVPPLGKGLAGRVVHRLAESKAGYPLNAWKYIGRLMSASDSIMFRGAKEGRAALLADRAMRSEGLRGKELNRRVQEELGRTTEQETLFRQQAKDEGFGGASEQARVNELRERSRSMEANADAEDFAGEATYNHKPKGILGYFATKVGEASEKHPALRTVVPFTQIVANVTNRGLNYTPWGFKRAFRGYSGELPPKGDARRAMLTRATMGTAGLGLLYTLQQQGALEIHGAGPSDPDKRKQLQDAGWRPYSVKMGDHYFSYLPTPLGLGMSILGNMSDVQRYGEMDQKSALMRGTYALSRVGSTIFSQSFLSSLSTMFEALSGQSPGQQLSAWRRLFSGVVGTATTPRIVLDVQRIFDPKRYESNTLAGDLVRNTPFAAMVNRPILNAFGEPIEPPTNRFISEVKDDPASRMIIEAGLRVPVPDKYTTMPDGRGGKRQITPEEYYEYLEKSGPLVKQYIVGNEFNLTHMEPDKAQDLLSKKSQEIRGRVLKEIRSRAQFTPAD